jgi:hypothetical protein
MAKLGGEGRHKARTLPPSNGSAKKPVTYRLPAAVKEAMLGAVVEERYGLKGKSRWVEEAVLAFLQDRSWKDQVLDGEMTMGNDTKDVVYLDAELKRVIEDSTRKVALHAAEMAQRRIRHENLDTLNVTVSSIIRAAIAWRFFGLRMPSVSANGK